MSKQWLNFDSFLKKQLKNPQFRKEYERQQPERMLMRKIIDARIKNGLTQKKLAKKLNTTQSAISRLESYRANPTLIFMKRLAAAFNTRLEINFRPLAT